MNFKTFVASLCLTLTACTTINPSTNPKEQTVNPVQTYPFLDLNAPNAPRLTAPQVLHRVINFIAHADSPAAFEQQNAEKLLGLKLKNMNKEYPERFTANQNIDNIWGWGLRFSRYSVDTTLIYNMKFNFASENQEEAYTPICQLDLNDFHREMEKIGMESQGDGHAGRRFRTFTKQYDNQYFVRVTVFYVGENSERIHHKCIDDITVSVFKE